MRSKKVAFLGLSITLAMVLSFVESQIPPLVAIPGIKVGLPNLVIVFLLYKSSFRNTVIVSIFRIFLVSLLFGNIQTMTFSLCGAVLSLLAMCLLKKIGAFSCVSVSIVGGICHNIGQIIAAIFWTETAEIVYYLPVLLISGTIAGTLIGICGGMLVKRLDKWKL